MTIDPTVRPGRGEPMRCPACGTRLVEIERSDVLIDACPSCRGVWLDRGELDKILVKERTMAAGNEEDDFTREIAGRRGSGSEERGGHHGDSGREKGRRRRGFFEELFD